MRYSVIVLVLSLLFAVASCAAEGTRDRLAYQECELHVEAVFSVDGEEVPAMLTLKAPEYDESGRMLARDATLTFGEGSIISGVSFEFSGGCAYVSSGNMKIPIENEDTVKGISDMISLFCISREFYYSSESVTEGGIECERLVYINGEDRACVTVDLSCMLPTNISANISGREISAKIKMIKAV